MSRWRIVALALLLFAAAGIQAQDSGAGAATYDVYIVQSGDSLVGLAGRFGATVDALLAANDMAQSRGLLVGESLLIPTGAAALVDVYEVKSGDTLFSIARRYQTSVADLLALNEMNEDSRLLAGARILTPSKAESALPKPPVDQPGDYAVYVVEHGDTLFDIARLHLTSEARLLDLNGLADARALVAGETLLAPRIDQSVIQRYSVRTGDSLYGIALQFDASLEALLKLNRLAEARAIHVGQVLLVPNLGDARLLLYAIQPGDSLEKIALEHETTIAALRALNGFDPDRALLPGEKILAPTPKPLRARPGFGFGLGVFIERERATDLAEMARQLGANWVKIDVPWSRIETAKHVYSYAALDAMISAMELADRKILLNVYDAPAWSRPQALDRLNSQLRAYAGPPDDLEDFGDFLANLAARYAGLVEAYEIWKSPNLLKYWLAPVYREARQRQPDGDYGVPDAIDIGAKAYASMLKRAYASVKAQDPRALVYAAGLAPVGWNDGYNSIDTGAFLRDMLAAGATLYSDGIGAIFSASAVPPTLSCCEKPPGVDSHFESSLQYFQDLLALYAEALRGHGAELPVVVTQLGWGTVEGANLAIPSSGFEWLTYTSEDEQALYVRQAFQIAQSLDYVDAVFLYNLNGCAAGDAEACFFSLEDADGGLRPAFDAFQNVPKSP